MVRRSFSNPLLRFTAKDRRKNENAENDIDDVHNDHRKVSIDQTVLSREGSHQSNAASDVVSSPPSFEVEEVVDQLTHALPEALIGDMPSTANGDYYRMTPSHSDHSLSNQQQLYPAASPLCSCIDCCAQVGHQRLSHTFQGGAVGVGGGSPPNHPPSSYNTLQNDRDKVNVDPALQARIEAVKIQEQILGYSHPDVIFALSGIAKLYEKRGDHAQAANIVKESQMRSIMAKSPPQGKLNGSYHEKEDVPIEISFPH